MNETLIALAIFTIAREVYFQYTINKLINKLMSRNYLDYEMSQSAPNRTKPKPSVKATASVDEDLGVLSGIG